MQFHSLGGSPLKPCVAAIAAAFALHAVAGSAQQIVPDGQTATSLAVQGRVTDVTTSSIVGPNAFNSFQRFDVWNGNTVNLHVPQAASNLINLIHGDVTRIDGILNTIQGGSIGGNVFFLNPHGIVVGRDGIINAGSLTLITPTKAFTDSFFDASGMPGATATMQVLAGQVPISETGLVFVQGRINASTDIHIQAGSVINTGSILSGAVYQHAKVDFSDVVNVAGLRNADTIRVENGVIEIVASGDIVSTGTIASEGADHVDGGNVTLRAGRDIRIDGGTISTRGSGMESSAGVALVRAGRDAWLSLGAAVNASGGLTGDGGVVEFSSAREVNLQGAGLKAAAPGGVAGTILIDPETINWTGAGQDVFSDGANYLLWATGNITLDNVTLSTRKVGAGNTSRTDHLDAASIGNSGNLYLWAGDGITLRNGTQLLAHATGTNSAGHIRVGDLGVASQLGLPDTILGSIPNPLAEGVLSRSVMLDSTTVRGGEITVAGTRSVTATNSTLVSRKVAAGADPATALSTGASADISVRAPAISFTGSRILAAGDNGFAGGKVELLAESIDFLGVLKNATAAIALAGTRVTGGEVDIAASADTSLLYNLLNNGKVPDLATAQTILDNELRDPLNAAGGVFLTATSKASAGVDITGGSYIEGSIKVDIAATAAARQGFDKQSTATITVDNSEVRGGDISIASKTDTSMVFNIAGAVALFTDSSSLPKDLTEISDQLFDFSEVSFVSLVESRARTLVNGASIIHGAGSVALGSEANSTAKPTTGTMLLSAAWGDVTSEATTTVGGTTAVTAGTSLGLTAVADAELNVNATSQATNKPIDITFAWGKLGSTVAATTGSQTSVTAGSIKVEAKTTADISVSAAAKEVGGSSAGIAVAVNQSETTTTATLAGTATSTAGSIDVGATADITRNSTSTDASSLGQVGRFQKFNNTVASTKQNVAGALIGKLGLLKPAQTDRLTSFMFPTVKEGKFNVGGAVSWADHHNTAEASVAAGAIVKAQGAVTVDADVTSKVNASANAKTTSTGTAIGGAGVIAAFENDARAFIGDGAAVDARGAITVEAKNAVPYPWQINWTSAVDVLNHLQGNLLDLALTSYALNSASGKDGLGLAVGLSMTTFDNDAQAWIGKGARVNQDTAFDDAGQSVKVNAANDVNSVDVVGIISPKILGNSGGKAALGGSVSIIDVIGNAKASIKDDALVDSGGAIDVDATSTNQLITVTVAGGKSDKIGVEGAVSLNIVRNDTAALVDDKAKLDAGGAISVKADSTLNNLAITGGVVLSKDVGVGLSVSLNFIRNDVRAYIGNEIGSIDIAPATGRVKAGGDVVVDARSNNDIGSYSVAGSVATGTAASSSTPTDAESTPDGPSQAGSGTSGGGSAGGGGGGGGAGGSSGKGKLGIAVSGDASVNDIESDTHAYIAGDITVSDAGNTRIKAGNTSDISALAGSVAISLASGKSAGLAGSFSFNDLSNDTRAYVDGATLTLRGELEARADNGGTIRSLTAAAGGAGKLGVAGSVSYSTIDNKTLAYLDGVNVLAATNALISAVDTATIQTIAGALSFGGKAGVGLSVALNNIANETRARLIDSDLDLSGLLGVTASSDNDIFAVSAAIGASTGNMAASGAFSKNDIANTTQALISGRKTALGTQADGAITIAAADTSDIQSVTGNLAVTTGQAGFGGSVSWNEIHNTVDAAIAGAPVTGGGTVGVDATNGATIQAIAVGGSGAAKVAIAGTFTYNDIGNTTSARVDGGSVLAAPGSISLSASDVSAIESLAGSVAGSGKVSAGAALAWNDIGNVVRASVRGASVESTAGRVDLSASSSGTIKSASAAGAGAGNAALAGAASINMIDNTVEAFGARNAGNTTAGTLRASTGVGLAASDTSTINSLAGAVSGAGTASAGASFAKNDIGDGAGGVAAYLDGTGSGATATAGGVSLTATSSSTIKSIAAAATGAGTFALGGSVALNDIDTVTEARIANGAQATGTGAVGLSAADTSGIESIAGSAAGAGSGAFGAAVATNEIGNLTRASIQGASVTSSAGRVDLSAISAATIRSLAAGIAASGSTAIAGGASLNMMRSTTEAVVGAASTVSGRDGLGLNAGDVSTIESAAGQVSIAADVGVGASAAYNDIANTIRTSSTGATLASAAGSITLAADSASTISTISAGGSGGGAVGIAGSAAINLVGNTVESFISGGNANADGSIGVTANSNNHTDIFGGTISIGGAVGLGGSAAVNVLTGITRAWIGDGASVTGLGKGAITVPNAAGNGTTSLRGVGVIARATDDIGVITANASGGGGVGLAATVSVTTSEAQTLAWIDDATVNALNTGADPLQSVMVKAFNRTEVDVKAGGLAYGGTAGIGATLDTTILANRTRAYIRDATQVKARGDIAIESTTRERVNTIVVSGAAAGTVSVAGSLGVVVMDNRNEAFAEGSTLRSEGDLRVVADDEARVGILDNGTRRGTLAGNVSVGGVAGVGGSIVVSTITNQTTARLTNVDAAARGTTLVSADTFTDLVSYAASGNLGAYLGAGGAVTVNTVRNTTLALIEERDGGSSSINQDTAFSTVTQDVSVTATDTARSEATLGAVSAGLIAGVGASIDVTTIRNTTSAGIGDGVAVGAGRDVSVTATATRTADSTVAAVGGGIVGVQGAVSIINIGANLSGDAATESKNTSSAVTSQISGSKLKGVLGSSTQATRAKTASDAKTSTLSVSREFDTAAPVDHATRASIGAGALVQAGDDIVVAATDTSRVNIIAGAAAGGLASLGGAVGFANVRNNAIAEVGAGAVLEAVDDITVSATGNLLASDIDAYAGAAGVVGIGAAVAYLDAQNNATARIVGSLPGAETRIDRADAVTVSAESNTDIGAEAWGVAIGSGALGGSYARARSDGSTIAEVGANTQVGKAATTTVGSLSVMADSDDQTRAKARAGAAGLFLSGSGAVADAISDPTVAARTGSSVDVDVNAGMTVSAVGAATAHASAIGASVSAGAGIGASLAKAIAAPTVTANVGDVNAIEARNILVSASQVRPGGRNAATSDAQASAGGLLFGAVATRSETRSDGDVRAWVGNDSSLTVMDHKSFGQGAVDNAANTITFATKHRFKTGDVVFYDSEGGALINGLSDGREYFVIVDSATRIRLASSKLLAEQGTAIDISRNLTSATVPGVNLTDATGSGASLSNINVVVDGDAGTLAFNRNHGFTDGQRIVYRGIGINGLTTGSSYFVQVVDARTIRLASSLTSPDPVPVIVDAVAGNGLVAGIRLADPVDNTVLLGGAVAVDNTGALVFGAPHSFENGDVIRYSSAGDGIAGLTQGTTYYVKVVDSTRIQLQTDSTTAQDISLASGTTVAGVSLLDAVAASRSVVSTTVTVDAAADTLTFAAAHPFRSGDRVVYTGSGITGLTPGATYVVQSVSGTAIKLQTDGSNYIDYGTVGESRSATFTTAADAPLLSNVGIVAGGTGVSTRSIGFNVDHAFTDGQQIKYVKPADGALIPGLSDGGTYFVRVVDRRTVQLTSTRVLDNVGIAPSGAAAVTGVSLVDALRPALIGATATVNGNNDTLGFATDHGFATGQQVVFKGSGITGLDNNGQYFALVVDSKTLKLATALSRTDLALAPTPAGVQPLVVTLTDNTGAGPSISNAVPAGSPSFSSVALGADNTLVFANNHGFATGTEFTFNGSGIKGLIDDQVYYVVARDARTLQLAASRDDAVRTANAPAIVALGLPGSDPGTPSYRLSDPAAGTQVRAATDSKQSATVSGISVSLLLALGSNESTATATTTTEARVGKGVSVSGGSLRVEALGLDDDYAGASSGSGGLISGAAASADVVSRTTTRAWIEGNDIGNRKLIDVQSLAVRAEHVATVNSRANSINAAALGLSGAWATNTINATVSASIGDHALVSTRDLTVDAANRTRKPLLADYNVESGSGGFINGAAAKSETNIANDTAATIGTGATVDVTGSRDAPGRFDLNALNDVEARDRAKLDAGGAIAIARAESIIRYENVENPNAPRANEARVVVGDDADLTSVGDINLAARTLIRGTDGNGDRTSGIETNANAKTYGLAGAAEGNAIARANTASTVVVGAGATLESLDDINLLAGRNSGGAANDIFVSARTDLWNKTVIPIETEPRADGVILQRNTVDVRAGADLGSVRDVNLVTDDGSTQAVGYGVGKDLYREALAAIGSAISGAFGGGPVSLDIKGGSTTVSSHNDVIVNGTVNSGIHHEQFLTIDALGNITRQSDGVSVSLLGNQSLQRQIQQRIVLLQQLADQYSTDPDVRGAFLAEKSFLEGKLAGLGGENIAFSFLDVDDILARSGNVNVTGDTFTGSGAIHAPGDVKIQIDNASDRFLRLGRLTIPEEAGGVVTFNGTAIANNADINARQRPGSVASLQTLETTFGPARPLISVRNTFNAPGNDPRPDPEIHLTGRVDNIRGTVAIASTGSVVVGARIEAQTVDIRTDGDFIQQYIWGFSHQGGAPRAQYNTFARSFENLYGTSLVTSDPFNLVPVVGSSAALPGSRESDPDLANPAIIAGNNIFVSAEKLNINGTIQSGLPLRSLVLGAGLNTTIANYGGTGPLALNTASPGNGEIAAFWNPATQKIEVNAVKVQGGYLEIYGNIFSTGFGKLRTIDGFGRISIDNQTAHEITLNRLDVGPGIAGTIRITDTAPDKRVNADTPLTTIYTRFGDSIRQVDNRTVDADGNANRLVAQTSAVGTLDADGQRVRTTTYQPDENRRYVWVTGRRSTLEEKEIYQTKTTLGFDFLGRDPGQQPTKRDVAVIDPVALIRGEFLEDVGSSGASKPDYEFEYNRFQDRNARVKVAEVADSWKTDCVKVLGCFSRIHQTIETFNTAVTQTYRHSIRADVPIGIEFFGYDNGQINVNSVKGVSINDSIVNRGGTTSITSTQGSIQQLSPTAVAYTQVFNLNADLGIGTAERAIRSGFQAPSGVDLTGTAAGATTIRFETRAGGVYLNQIEGQARIDRFTSQVGDARLVSDAGIVALNANALVKGGHVDLTSSSGAIGSVANPLRIQVGSARDGDGLRATAAGDIGLRQVAGDLWVEKIRSGGDVRVEVANGSILDVNPVETRDERTVTELENLWSSMRLIGEAKTLADPTIKGFERQKEREYQTYWRTVREVKEVIAPDGTRTYTAKAFDPDQGFALTVAERDYYRNNHRWVDTDGKAQVGFSDAQIAQFELDRAREYGVGAYDPGFRFTYNVAADPNKLTTGAAWTAEELRYSVSAGALKEVSDTNPRLEDPNIAGRNVTVVTSNGGIGRNGVGREVEITIPGAGSAANLTQEQILALAAAERRDLKIVGNKIVISNPEDINIDATGVVALTAGRTTPTTSTEIYVGSTGDLRLGEVLAEDAIRIKAKGFITQSGIDGLPLPGAFIRGGDLIVEAGRGILGADGNALRLRLKTAATLTARAAGDIWLEAETGDLNIDTVYSPGEVHLKAAAGAIVDAIGDDQDNIRGRTIALDAALNIGTTAAALDVHTDAGRDVTATAAGGGIALRSLRETLTLGALDARGPIDLTGGAFGIGVAGTVASHGGDIALSADGITFGDGAFIDAGIGDLSLVAIAGSIVRTGAGLDLRAQDLVATASGGAIGAPASRLRGDTTGAVKLSGEQGVAYEEAIGDLDLPLASSATGTVDLLVTSGDAMIGDIVAPTVRIDVPGAASIDRISATARVDVRIGGNTNVLDIDAGELDLRSGGNVFIARQIVAPTARLQLAGLGAIDTMLSITRADVRIGGDARFGSLGSGKLDVRVGGAALAIGDLSFRQANLEVAGRGGSLNVGRADALASHLRARADVIDLSDVIHAGPGGVLSFDLAGFGGGMARSVNVDAFSPSAIRFDVLRAETATIRGDVADLKFMETLIGRNATFANRFYRVLHDNAARGAVPGYDMQVFADAPFYLYFEAGKKFETSATVITYGEGFSPNGGGSENSLMTFAPKLLNLTNPSRTAPGEIAFAAGGNGPLVAPAGLVTVPFDPLGRNPGAIDGPNDATVNPR